MPSSNSACAPDLLIGTVLRSGHTAMIIITITMPIKKGIKVFCIERSDDIPQLQNGRELSIMCIYSTGV